MKGSIYLVLPCPCYAANQHTAIVGKANFDMLVCIDPLATNKKTVIVTEWEWTFMVSR
jgi:hypothetical protein